MGGLASKRKGQVGEREAAALLQSLVGFKIVRNLGAARDGGIGGDLNSTNLGGFGIEIKRAENIELRSWWAQACRQARAARVMPALMYRRSREPWRVLLAACDVIREVPGSAREDYTYTVQMAPEAFAALVRERLAR